MQYKPCCRMWLRARRCLAASSPKRDFFRQIAKGRRDLDEVSKREPAPITWLAMILINRGIRTHFDVVFENDSPTLLNRDRRIFRFRPVLRDIR